mmetsp:Transcript_21352/g.27597  ORF Transcript_21352/g.27597 Transcript_21352/m.27597 type:complete len:219 (+) Transcript_21352:141-797(+)
MHPRQLDDNRLLVAGPLLLGGGASSFYCWACNCHHRTGLGPAHSFCTRLRLGRKGAHDPPHCSSGFGHTDAPLDAAAAEGRERNCQGEAPPVHAAGRNPRCLAPGNIRHRQTGCPGVGSGRHREEVQEAEVEGDEGPHANPHPHNPCRTDPRNPLLHDSCPARTPHHALGSHRDKVGVGPAQTASPSRGRSPPCPGVGLPASSCDNPPRSPVPLLDWA